MVRLTDNSQKAEHVAEVMKALAHPLRIRILAVLSAGVQENVTGLANRLGVSQSVLSQQLRILQTHGLLVGVRDGSSVRYTLARPRLKELVKYLDGCPD
jgi:DNA-binding transcriptional ArsR family regulator